MTDYEITNMTNHNVTIVTPHGVRIIPPCGLVARIDFEKKYEKTITVDGLTITVNSCDSGRLTGLPPPEKGRLYIVSSHVANHNSVRGRRDDCLVPDVGNAIRSGDGQVAAVGGFVRYVV